MRRLLPLLLLLLPALALAQAKAGGPTITLGPGGLTTSGLGLPNPGGKTGDVATSLQIVALLTVLSLAPALLILTTAFTRIVIVFSFVRSALGTPNIPPTQVVVGLSLFLTFFVMGPTYKRINADALQPFMAHKIGQGEALAKAAAPARAFMLRNTYEGDLKLFLDIRKERPAAREDVNFTTLVPAFVISELKTAFIVGFYIFVPFLVIDLVVASGLMSMGMMMLPPTTVSLPAKLLVFVLADGWGTLVSAILQGYR